MIRLPPPAALPSEEDWRFLHGVGQVCFANPFDDARPVAERLALGDDYSPSDTGWCRRGGLVVVGENGARLAARLSGPLERVRALLDAGGRLSDAQRVIYLEACFYRLFGAHEARFQPYIDGEAAPGAVVLLYADFLAEHGRLLRFPDVDLRAFAPEHLFACCYQLRRALHHISSSVLGRSPLAAALRADIWRAIFTHNLRRYTRSCDRRRMDVSTLILGETGTGKELAAQAIGCSGYVPYLVDERRFALAPGEGFHAVNLSALSESLFEAELFGHERGAFTGAVKDRAGIFSACGPHGAVLFDEIGELSLPRQVTLLRVLEARRFHRVGDTREQVFSARVLAATHRNLAREIREGTFRLDVYERLAGIQITTPALRRQLEAAPGERRALVRHFLTARAEPDELEAMTDEVEAFIDAHLPGYGWPGNVRELKRCAEGVYATGTFVPLDPSALKSQPPPRPPPEIADEHEEDDPLRSVRGLELSEQAVVQRYASMVFEKLGEKQDETARTLGINRKSVPGRLDHAWLAKRAQRRGRRGR